MKSIFFAKQAVELRLSKIRRGFAKDLVGLSKFTNLTLKLFNPRNLSAGRSRTLAAIALDLPHPDAKAIRRTAQFTRDRRQRRSFTLILIAVFHSQPHRTFAELGGIRLQGLLL
jgi:hypothetical protein